MPSWETPTREILVPPLLELKGLVLCSCSINRPGMLTNSRRTSHHTWEILYYFT